MPETSPVYIAGFKCLVNAILQKVHRFKAMLFSQRGQSTLVVLPSYWWPAQSQANTSEKKIYSIGTSKKRDLRSVELTTQPQQIMICWSHTAILTDHKKIASYFYDWLKV